MSEHSKILEKYEKMFEDGSAYRPIHLNQATPEDILAQAGSGEVKPDIPLGEQVDKDVFMDDPHKNYAESDAYMQNRVDEVRNKVHGNNSNVSVQNNSGELERLVKRVDLLEQALSLVMETQKKLLQS